MIKGRRRAYRRVHRAKGFPLCLPSQADLEAVYLGKNAPSSAGVVTDESGNSNDAQLVNSYALQGDGTVYAVGNSDALHDGNSVDIDILFKTPATLSASYNILMGKSATGSGEMELYLQDVNIRCFIADNASSYTEFNVLGLLSINTVYRYRLNINVTTHEISQILDKYELTGGHVVITNLYTNTSTTTLSSINNANSAFMLLNREIGGNKSTAALLHAKYGYTEYNLCNGGLIEAIPNTGTAGGDATLFNATYPTLWALQDVFHYNFLNGFDLYENGNAGEEIRVPIGHPFSQSGYTLTSSNVAGAWHNGAETEIDLDDTLKAVVDGDITDPLGYDDFLAQYGLSAISNTEVNKKRQLCFWDRDLTAEETAKALKCIKMNIWNDLQIWNDDNLWTD